MRKLFILSLLLFIIAFFTETESRVVVRRGIRCRFTISWRRGRIRIRIRCRRFLQGEEVAADPPAIEEEETEEDEEPTPPALCRAIAC